MADLKEADKAVLNTIFNPLDPGGNDGSVAFENTTEDLTPEIVEAKRLEVDAVKLAEAGHTEEAIFVLTTAIQLAPSHASAYNNRAQARRLKGDIAGALADLNEAIRLSQGEGTAACQAFTQRGLIRKLEGHDDEAQQDFKYAAALGNEFAKAMVIQMNPYAAMCNRMLSDILGKLRRGEYRD